jgi:hypothetical protein
MVRLRLLPGIVFVLALVGPAFGARAESHRLAGSAVTIAGTVVDVVDGTIAGAPGVLVSHTTSDGRRLSFLTVGGALQAGPVVPASAVAAALCDGVVHFIEDRGLVQAGGNGVGTARGVGADGGVVIARPPLLAVPDPSALPFADLCPTPHERMLLVAGGMAVATVDDDGAGAVTDTRLLAFQHRARAYGGHGGRALRGERPYSTALSLYAPRMLVVDVDGDADLDLVAVHERRLLIFVRGSDGRLALTPIERDVGRLASSSAEADLRVVATTQSLIVAASVGALPERTDIVELTGTAAAPLAQVRRRRRVEGLALLLGARGGDAVLARIDTSLVALSGVVLTGRVPLELQVGSTTLMTLPTVADVRAGRIDGALPVVNVDLDGDGVLDLVDLGEPGRAVLWRGTGGTFVAASTAMSIPRLERALGAPGLGRVVLVGRPGSKGTAVLLLRAEALPASR